jgi:protein-disulfide isomerase
VENEPEIIETYVASGQVKIVYRHLLQIGEETIRAAEASECAADQGQFWEMRTALYERQSELYGAGDIATLDTTLAGIAGDLGLDGGAFGECRQNRTHLQAIEADFQAARQEGVQNRPVFDINGQRLVGPQQPATFQQVIDSQLTTR